MLKFLETVWLIIAVMAAALTAFSFVGSQFDRDDTIWFTIITVVAAGMFYVRRKMRIQNEKKF